MPHGDLLFEDFPDLQHLQYQGVRGNSWIVGQRAQDGIRKPGLVELFRGDIDAEKEVQTHVSPLRKLLQSRLQHEMFQRLMLPYAKGGKELIGGDLPALPVPAGQGLEARHPACRQGHQWLIAQGHRSAGQGTQEILAQRFVAYGEGTEIRVIEPHPPFARPVGAAPGRVAPGRARLGAIHGLIRVPQDEVGVTIVEGVDAQPQTRMNVDHFPIDVEGLCYCGLETSQDLIQFVHTA